jgi:hypothetical protein
MCGMGAGHKPGMVHSSVQRHVSKCVDMVRKAGDQVMVVCHHHLVLAQ